ncbi:VOC family protein [bacterium]|nr:VOC family protein [bacterium]
MAKVQPIPPGHENLIPHLVCDGAAKAIDFYTKAFGAEEIHRMPGPDGRLMHAAMKLGNSIFFLNDDFPEYCGGAKSSPLGLKGTPVTIHRYVPSVDAAMKQAVEAGATVVMPAADMFWGDRYGIVADPFGHKWSVATHIEDMTSAEMQEAVIKACSEAPQQHP